MAGPATAQPQLVNLSNILIAGCVAEIKHHLNVPVLVTLQGDDLFLEELTQPYKDRALAEIRRAAKHVDGFIVFSRYYADFMAGYLGLDRSKFHVVPLGLNLDDYPFPPTRTSSRPPTIGYLARICPEKGFHLLVDAFLELATRPDMQHTRLEAAGWLGLRDEAFFRQQLERIAAAGLADRFRYAGVVDRAQKLEFLRGIDVLSVPTVYQEPKGLFVLEAWASGLPVVQPNHGAFPEMLGNFGAGRLVRPHDSGQLADAARRVALQRRCRGVPWGPTVRPPCAAGSRRRPWPGKRSTCIRSCSPNRTTGSPVRRPKPLPDPTDGAAARPPSAARPCRLILDPPAPAAGTWPSTRRCWNALCSGKRIA